MASFIWQSQHHVEFFPSFLMRNISNTASKWSIFYDLLLLLEVSETQKFYEHLCNISFESPIYLTYSDWLLAK